MDIDCINYVVFITIITKIKYSISGWWYTYPSEKYEFVSWNIIPNTWNNKKGSKPPTRHIYILYSKHINFGHVQVL